MKEESGRSLVEIIGVLAIGAIMIASAYSIYQSINSRQTRLIASETLKDVAAKTKTLYEFSGYGDLTATGGLDKLVTDCVLTNTNPPIGGGWSIASADGGDAFIITLKQLSYDDCEYFAVKKSDWAKEKKINSDGGTCVKNPTGDKNMVSFKVQ